MIPNYLKAAYRRNPAATRCKLNWSQGFKFPGLQKYIYIYIYLVIIPSSSMCPLTFVFRSRAAHSYYNCKTHCIATAAMTCDKCCTDSLQHERLLLYFLERCTMH